jgi:hypothetical protein
MTRPELEAFLRTPRGVLTLLGGSLAFSVVLALGIGSQRAWFESRVREKYEPVLAAAQSLGEGLHEDGAAERVRYLSKKDKERLYGAWMQGAEGWPSDAPRILIAADPFFLERAEATLLLGSPDQRRQAVRFLVASGDARVASTLREAARRARRRGEEPFAKEVESALSALTGGNTQGG